MAHSVTNRAYHIDIAVPIGNIHLIKRDLNYNVIEWRLEAYPILGDSISYEIATSYGRYDGNSTNRQSIKEVVAFDSIDKYNKYVKAIVDRKLKLGYKFIQDYNNVEDLPRFNTDVNNLCKPMKCQKFIHNRFIQGMIGQGKVNGVRAIVMYDNDAKSEGLFDTPRHIKILSKEGLRYDIAHIETIFEEIYKDVTIRDIVFDGELYIPNEYVTTIGGAARNSKNPNHSNISYIIFDLAIVDILQKDRLDIASDIIEKCIINKIPNIFILKEDIEIIDRTTIKDGSVYYLEGIIVNSVDQCIPYMERQINRGFEGAVFRHPSVIYKFGQRPTTMIKAKKGMDSEFKIIHIDLIKETDSNIGVSLLYTLQNDLDTQTFICGGVGTVKEKTDIYNNRDQHIGKMATVKYYERTKFKLPFHANVIGIRDYE